MDVPKSLMTKKKVKRTSKFRQVQVKLIAVRIQTSYIKRIKVFFFAI